MVLKQKEWPNPGELVIGKVVSIEKHGAYVTLEEYNNKEGLIHISEIASSWVRNIRNFVKEKQRVVLKVINVDPRKGHINLSLRRVNQNQKKEKRKEWKRAQKADGLLNLAVKMVNQGKTIEDAYKEVGWILEDKYGDIYTGFETIKKKKMQDLTKIGIPKIWAGPILEIINQYIEIPSVSISGEFILRSFAPNGIEIIKSALEKAENFNDEKKMISVKIISVGAPKYKIDLEAPNYKIAETILSDISKTVIDEIVNNNGIAQFSRE
ncbi:MAG: translation initiation factor IF-2 subunit alpha [Candidatus Helarchaeota archaeon]